MDPVHLTQFGAVELARAVTAGDVSARDVVDAHVERIEAVDAALNAVVLRRFEAARDEADAADAARRRGAPTGPLHGVPVVVKDQFDVTGLPTTFGTPSRLERVAQADDRMVAAWRRAGAIVLGKGNVPQYLQAIETDNAPFGRTNNPWDPRRTPGGSSGADAAIVAAGGVPLALGADLGGSLRIPAAWCGVTTLAPTPRRFPAASIPGLRTALGRDGIVAVPGPIARTTADLDVALRVMAEDLVAHPGSEQPPVAWRDPARVELDRTRIAIVPIVNGWTPAPALRRALDEAAGALRAAGAEVEWWDDAPVLDDAVRLGIAIASAAGAGPIRALLGDDAPHALLRGDLQLAALPNAFRAPLAQVLRAFGQQRATRVVPCTYRLDAAGLLRLLDDRCSLEAAFLTVLAAGGCDAVVFAPTACAAPPHRSTAAMVDANLAALACNVLGIPSGVVPVTTVRSSEETDRERCRDGADRAVHDAELGSAGLPVGVMVAARPWREDVVLALMRAIEAAVTPPRCAPIRRGPRGAPR